VTLTLGLSADQLMRRRCLASKQICLYGWQEVAEFSLTEMTTYSSDAGSCHFWLNTDYPKIILGELDYTSLGYDSNESKFLSRSHLFAGKIFFISQSHNYKSKQYNTQNVKLHMSSYSGTKRGLSL
jgi:hypothetical protein